MHKLETWLLLGFCLLAAACDDGNRNDDGNNAAGVCGNGIAETDEWCDGEDFRGASCESIGHGFVGGTLACTSTCQYDVSGCIPDCGEDACTPGEILCSSDGTARRVCRVQADGCPAFEREPCPADAPHCRVADGWATCFSEPCPPVCTPGESRCGDEMRKVETCVLGMQGCPEWSVGFCDVGMMCVLSQDGAQCVPECTMECWEMGLHCNGEEVRECNVISDSCSKFTLLEDCAADGRVCRLDASGTPSCQAPLPGDDCNRVETIPSLPFHLAADNFASSFSDAIPMWNCGGFTGPERVFTLDMTAGQRVAFSATGQANFIWYALSACTNASPTCLADANTTFGGTETLIFTPPADGTYFFVLEMDRYAADAGTYTIDVFIPDDTETSCTDGRDNDLNGPADCFDTACWGVFPCPALVYSEEFRNWPPLGWTIENGGDPAYAWFSSVFDTQARDLYLANGLFAMIDSQVTGAPHAFDDSLVSPPIDFSAATLVELEFVHFYLDGSPSDSATVLVSADDGSTWTPVRAWTSDGDIPPWGGERVRLDISAIAAGHSQVRVRFRYATTGLDYYWLLDSVRLFAR